MCDGWHIISRAKSTIPEDRQLIYLCIVDGDCISTVRAVISDLKYLDDLLYLHPKWIILWKPLPPLPTPPDLSTVLSCIKEVPYGEHTR